MTPKPVVLIALLLSFLAATAHAQEPRFTVRALGLRSDLSRHDLTGHGGDVTQATTEANPGPALSLEYRPARLIGFDLTAIRSELDQHFVTTFTTPTGPRPVSDFSQTLRFQINTLGLAIHPLQGRHWDLGIGPFAGQAYYDGGGNSLHGFAWGGAATFEWPLGSGRWALAAQARYLSAEKPNGLGSPEQTFEMWWTGAGISWRSGRR
jgi:hypothetical protein